MRKNIMITGASSGLGAEMARQFAAKGYNLALCARRVERLESLKAELETINPQATVLIRALDVVDYDKVFSVSREIDEAFIAATGNGIDRYIVNAGIGKGLSIGFGGFAENKETLDVNLTASLAQAEIAMELFRKRKQGHLVFISSMSAMRGMRGAITTYGMTKAAVATLAEGIRMDVLNKPKIKISTIYPGYIRSEINENAKKAPFMVDTKPGVEAMVKAIEKEVDEASVPKWPWVPLGWAMRNLPLSQVRKIM